MSDKAKSIYFAVFTVLYFIYTVFIVNHGIHWTNTLITFIILGLAVFYYMKNRSK